MWDKPIDSVEYLRAFKISCNVLAETGYHRDIFAFFAGNLQHFQDIISALDLNINPDSKKKRGTINLFARIFKQVFYLSHLKKATQQPFVFSNFSYQIYPFTCSKRWWIASGYARGISKQTLRIYYWQSNWLHSPPIIQEGWSHRD